MARCKISDCNKIAVYGPLCARHKVYDNANKKHNETKFTKYPWQKIYYTNSWKKLREMHLAGHPLCVICGAVGKPVDHIIDHKGDRELFFDASNLQTLCTQCHTEKTFRDNDFNVLKRRDDLLFTFNLVDKTKCQMLALHKATGIDIHTDHIYKLLAKRSDNIYNLSDISFIINLYKHISIKLKFKPKVNSNNQKVLDILTKE